MAQQQPVSFEEMFFRPTRQLSQVELAALGAMGLELETAEPEGEFRGNKSTLPNAEEEHYRKVYPQDAEAYVGKEVFWLLGSEVGLSKTAVGKLFIELCFPLRSDMAIRKTRGIQAKLEPVEPNEIGLNVSTRKEKGVPKPPFKIAFSNPGGNTSYHGYSSYERTAAETDAVILLKSILDFGRSRTDINFLLSAEGRKSIGSLWPRLEEIEASPAT